jgi:hypothetical protein
MLMTTLMDGVRGTTILECIPRLIGVYARFGFSVVRTFPEPSGPDLTVMQAG